MSVNAQGEFEGFDVDVAKAIATRMNKQLVIKDLGSLASCFIALKQNKIFSGLDITQERLVTLQMVPYAGQNIKEFFLVFYKSLPAGVLCIEDLKKIANPVVCVEPGQSAEKFLDKFGYIRKKSLNSLSDMILDLQYGKSLAAFLEPQVIKKFMQTRPEMKCLPVPLPPEFQMIGFGIALKKENISLKDKVAEVVKCLRQDGIIQKYEIQWQLTGV